MNHLICTKVPWVSFDSDVINCQLWDSRLLHTADKFYFAADILPQMLNENKKKDFSWRILKFHGPKTFEITLCLFSIKVSRKLSGLSKFTACPVRNFLAENIFYSVFSLETSGLTICCCDNGNEIDLEKIKSKRWENLALEESRGDIALAKHRTALFFNLGR